MQFVLLLNRLSRPSLTLTDRVPTALCRDLGRCSLSCETYSGTPRSPARLRSMRTVSVRRRARRTAEPSSGTTYTGTDSGSPIGFQFAVVRDLQRNGMANATARTDPRLSGFYPLSCETYSGTQARLRPRRLQDGGVSIRCVRDVQRNRFHSFPDKTMQRRGFYSLSCETYSGTGRRCRLGGQVRPRFYSLSCETCSGTTADARSRLRLTRFYSLSCETYSETSPSRPPLPSPSFYSLSCETYSGTPRIKK